MFLLSVSLLNAGALYGQCNSLVNPSFELPGGANGNNILGGGVHIPGWRVGGTASFNLVRPNGSYGGGPNTARTGTQYLDIANSSGIFSQVFDLTCPTTLTFGGWFSSREAGGYVNWTASVQITTITGTVVATSSSRAFTSADADGNPSEAVWYQVSGTSASLPAGRYIFKVNMGDFGNFEDASVCPATPACYRYPNADGDALSLGNVNDIDDDNDGITDLVENGGFDAYGDPDNDGIPNYSDATPGTGQPFTDANGDGLNDAYDNDRDGLINSEDLDGDNDGVADLVEAGGIDTDGDGKVDVATDTDGDGLANTYDVNNGGVNIANLDTDGDGVANTKDLDSDNDGVPDVLEAGGVDGNNDGRYDPGTDADADGYYDDVDSDVGNDGTIDYPTRPLIITSIVGGTPGRPAGYPRGNFDGDAVPNPYDVDADGDGILDSRESGLNQDTDNNGVVRNEGTWADTNGDGWSDAIDAIATALAISNTDAANRPDYLDIDADNDGLTDNVEAQTTAGYQLPSGNDADGDGIDDTYDNNDAAFAGATGNGITPNNHDGADNPDYTDADSDNDGVNDLREGTGNPSATLTNTADTDGDGLVDQFDIFNLNTQTMNLQNNVTVTGMGNGGGSTGPSPAGSNVLANQTNGAAPNRDWRNALQVLPVRLLAFTAVYNNGTTALRWTAEELPGFDHYLVERSTNGVAYGAVATVKGTGSRHYQITDNALPAAATVYYRLKWVDANGSFRYSRVVAIKLNDAVTTVSVYPNPVADNITVSFTSVASRNVSVNVYAASGKRVIAKTIAAQQGINNVQVQGFDRLPAGEYVVEVLNGDSRFTQIVSHLR